MAAIYNGMSSARLGKLSWSKSRRSNPSGNCVELAVLANGQVAMRNSRHPAGPVLIYGKQDISAFVRSVKEGEFDDLI